MTESGCRGAAGLSGRRRVELLLDKDKAVESENNRNLVWLPLHLCWTLQDHTSSDGGPWAINLFLQQPSFSALQCLTHLFPWSLCGCHCMCFEPCRTTAMLLVAPERSTCFYSSPASQPCSPSLAWCLPPTYVAPTTLAWPTLSQTIPCGNQPRTLSTLLRS
jgi:hypothetical protein